MSAVGADRKERQMPGEDGGSGGGTSSLRWRKSSRSGPYSDNCVEVAQLPGGVTAMRDSKDPDGPVLTFGDSRWTSFIAGVRAGLFDEPRG
jgi:hypothetical protein